MKSRSIILICIGILFLSGVVWAFSKWKAYAPTTYIEQTTNQTGATTSITINTAADTSTPGAPTFTMADVAMHKDASSCYSVISGIVYDLTMWVNLHPGGKQAILSICGIDGTQRFMAQHHGAQKQMDILVRFKIGIFNADSTSQAHANTPTPNHPGQGN